MNTGSPRLLVIPNADLNMDNPEAGSYLEQLLTFRKKKSLMEKMKSAFLEIGRIFKKVRGRSCSTSSITYTCMACILNKLVIDVLV